MPILTQEKLGGTLLRHSFSLPLRRNIIPRHCIMHPPIPDVGEFRMKIDPKQPHTTAASIVGLEVTARQAL